MSIATKTPIITTIQKIIEANHEVEDHTEAKIWVDHLDPRTTTAEVNIIKIKFKATTIGIITTQVIINTIKDSSKIHAEDITKVMDTANLAAEAVDALEEVSVCANAAGVI